MGPRAAASVGVGLLVFILWAAASRSADAGTEAAVRPSATRPVVPRRPQPPWTHPPGAVPGARSPPDGTPPDAHATAASTPGVHRRWGRVRWPPLCAGALTAVQSVKRWAWPRGPAAPGGQAKGAWLVATVAEDFPPGPTTVRVFSQPELYAGHRVLRGFHPENQGRLEAIATALSRAAARLGDRLEVVAPALNASTLAVARTAAVLAHSEAYVSAIAAASRRLQGSGESPFLEGDTYATEATYDAALAAMASWLAAAHHALETGRPAMSISRPPGHHATRTRPMGFCLVNFAAAAALHVLRHCPAVQRVAILDWDVHQGNGLVDILADEPRVRYVSLHQVPAYPYQGQALGEVGPHRNCRNVPVAPDTTWEAYRELFVTHALPFLNDPLWGTPDLVIVCAGYDACAADPLAGVCLQPEDFGEMARLLRRHLGPGVPISLGLEGGYDYAATAGAVLHTVEGLAEPLAPPA
eukprot:EG_transcript_10228